jgi:hypothetical protein
MCNSRAMLKSSLERVFCGPSLHSLENAHCRCFLSQSGYAASIAANGRRFVSFATIAAATEMEHMSAT